MKKSALYDILPSEKVPGEKSGWAIALSFGDPEAEFQAALDGCAIADGSMCGRIEVTGNDRLDLLHRLSTNSLDGLSEGKITPTVFVTDKGRVIDRVVVCARKDSLLLVTSPGAELFLTHWIEKYTITEDISFKTVTDETVMVSLVGPRIISTCFSMLNVSCAEQTCTGFALEGTEYFALHSRDSRAEIAHVVSGTAGAAPLMKILRSVPGARWTGQTGFEAFRIDRGIPASPGELNDLYNPLECGLRDSISFTKGCYIGQEVIARLDTYGKVRRHLARIESGDPVPGPLPIPVVGNGAEAGMLTSMTEIPFRGRYIGLAIARSDIAVAGEILETGTTGAHILVTGTTSGT